MGSKIVNEIYMGDYGDISAQLKIYQRLLEYIGANQNISAIFKIYRQNMKKGAHPKIPFGTGPPQYYFSFKKVRSFKNKFQKKINPGNKIAIPIAYKISNA